ncbi:MAG: protein-tyrosine phosphatase family protein, partial [Bryobacteraceae bacterium]
MIPDLFWIPGPWTGRLAIVARPRGGDWLDDEASGWRRAGLDVVVSLLEEQEAAQLGLEREDQAAASNDVRFLSFPIADRGAPASTQGAVALLKDMIRALDAGKNVAVHCRQGIGRSGLIA